MAPADRFFAATALGGRLHIRGIPDWGPWVILSDITGDRKAWIREELEAAMRESMGPTPTRYVWTHESLEDEAHRLWEQMAADRKRT